MRIERIELDGFGRFHDARWSLDDGLTVLHGANEAGKTTLLNALRALLFGFEASRDGRTWYPAFAGGRRGGRLSLRTVANERWTVERHGERGGGGALAVRAPNGNQGGQETLDRLLHGADKDVFNAVFAFGLGELQTFGSLSAEGVRGRIYGAGAGHGGTSALDVERRLRQQLDADFLPSGSKRPLNALLTRIEEVRRTVADLGHQPEEHAAAHRERQALVERARVLRAEAAGVRDELARLGRLREARPVALALAELEAELAAGDASLDAVPDDAAEVLDRMVAGASEARAVLATLDTELEEARRVRSTVASDPQLLGRAEEVAAASAEWSRMVAGQARRRDLEVAADRQHAVVAEQLARVGDWDEARLVALDDSIPTVQATREHEASLTAARAAAAAAEERRRALADDVEADGVVPEEADDVTAADIESRLAALRELEDATLRLPATAEGSGPARSIAIAIAVLAAAVALLGGLLASAPVAGLAAAAASGLAAYLVATRFLAPGGSAPGPRIAELLDRAGLPAGAGRAQIAAARDQIATVRARRDLAAEARGRATARRDELARRGRDAASAARVATEAEEAWRTWLSDHGLPGTASPDAARDLLSAAGTARRAARERDHHRRQVEAFAREEAEVEERVDGLLAGLRSAGFSTPGERSARLASAVERLEESRAEDRRGRELDERIAQLTVRRAPALDLVEEREAALSTYLAALGCPDPDKARRRAMAAVDRRRLRGALRERRSQLALLGGDQGHDDLAAAARVTDPVTLDAADAGARATLERLEGEEREATTGIGALDARIANLEAAEDLGEARQALAILEGRAAAMAREWAVRAVALRLLEETRARYERERQPDVVRAAESHFERITGGRYARIVAPPGDADVRVETEGGEARTTDELSRGTAEQLYLALRFGLIEEFARHGEPLPVVMDDILVNFDADRATRAAAAIRGLAERHQVLYFTCHAWTVELLDPDGTRTVPLG